MNQFYTAESVTEGHPDKLCDLIADSVLDECLSHDALSRVACEVMATRGQIIVAGEITSLYEPSIPSIVRSVLRKVGYNPARFAIQCLIHKQSPDIAAGVDCSLEQRRNVDGSSPSLQLGAGDQGVMVGYACSETPQMLPLPVVLAHRLTSALTIARKSGAIQGLRPDGKAQVTVEYDEDGKPFRLDTVVLSAQHSPEIPTDELCFELTDKVIAPALQGYRVSGVCSAFQGVQLGNGGAQGAGAACEGKHTACPFSVDGVYAGQRKMVRHSHGTTGGDGGNRYPAHGHYQMAQ